MRRMHLARAALASAVLSLAGAAAAQQAGVPVEFVRLEDHGLRGNGHMMMIEKNNLEIAGFVHGWFLKKNLK